MNRYNSGGPSRATSTTLCQKCLKRGHYSYECTASKQDRPYTSRPSRSQQLLNPKLAPKLTSQALEPKTIIDTPQFDAPNTRKPGDRPRSGKVSRPPREGKRRRSASSYSSDSVSTTSTARSRSRSPPRKRKGEGEREGFRSKDPSDRQNGSPAATGRPHSPPRGRRRSRSCESRSLSPSRNPPPPQQALRENRDQSDRRSRSPYRGPAGRVREPASQMKRERSPNSQHRRNAPDPGLAGNQGSEMPANKHEARGPAGGSVSKRERSLSPYSRRIALTKAMNRG